MQWFYKYQPWWGRIIFIAAFLLYVNTIPNDYNLDDELVTRNHRLTSQGLSAIPDIISSYYYEDKFGHKYDYRPVVHISFALEHEFLGESPHISHLINTVLYALMCWLLWLFLSNLFPQNLKLLAWIATVLFVFHPMHTEVVASIKNRDEILALGFALASGLILLKGFEKNGNWIFFIPASILLLLGFFSKITILPMALIIPLGFTYFSEKNDKTLEKFLFVNVFLLIASIFSDISLQMKILIIMGGNLLIYFVAFLSPDKNFIHQLSSSLTHFIKSNASFNQNFENWKNGLGFFKWKGGLPKSWIIVLSSIAFFILFVYTTFFNFYLSVFTFPLLFIGLLISLRYIEIFISSLLILLGIVLLNQKINVWEVNFFINAAFSLIIFFQNRNKLFQISLIVVTAGISLFLQKERIMRPEALIHIVIPLAAYFSSHNSNSRYYYGFLYSIPVLVIAKVVTMLLDFQFYYGFIALVLFIPLSIYWVVSKKFSFLPIGLLLVSILMVTDRQITFLSYDVNLSEVPQITDQDVFIDKNDEDTYRPLFFAESPVNMSSSLNERLGTGMFVFSKYIQKLFVPYPMGYYYGYAYVKPYLLTHKIVFLFLFIFFIASIPFAFYLRIKGHNVASFSVFALIISFIPVLNVFFPIAGVMGDRYLLIPSLGYCILIAYGIYLLITSEKYYKVGILVFGFLLAVYGYLTIDRNFQWKDKLTLFENDIEYLNQSAQAYSLLGSEYMAIARNTENEELQKEWIVKSKNAYQNAINIYPNFWNWHFINGINNMSLGLYDDALLSYKNSIEKNPNFSHEPYFYIGYIYYQQGNLNEAANYFEKTLELGHKTPEIYNYLAACYSTLGIPENALSSLLEGISLYPNDYSLNLNTGKTYYNLNDYENAKLFLSKALNIDNRDKDIVRLLQSIE